MEPGEEFWKFSLSLYAKPNVAPACLALQDEHGKDVVLALYCAWLGASDRGLLDAAGLAQAEATVAPWRAAVIVPIRTLRKSLKGIGGAEAIYGKMKGVELDAERAAHDRLAALAPAVGSGGSARANLALYLGHALADAEPILAALNA